MMLAWMLTTVMFGAWLALVAASAQPIARVLGWSTRWIWCVALAVASLWPVLWQLAIRVLPSLADVAIAMPAIAVAPDGAALLARSPAVAIALAGRVALGVWAIASALLAHRLVRSVLFVRRIRASAERRLLDGDAVLMTDGLGPATIGLRRRDVLVPRELLGLEVPLRRLVLRHEREHCDAGDPRLLFCAAIAVTLFPWNPALWLISRRLHLALEVDCDARVLASGADPTLYSRLLLMMAQRRGPSALAPTLATPPSHLERRIVAMRSRLNRPRPLQLTAAGAFVVLGVAGACSAGAPDAPRVVSSAVQSRRADSTSKPANAYFEFKLDEQARQLPGTGALRYPDAMRQANREGEVLAQFIVDERGIVDPSTLKVLKSTDPAFTAAVQTALPTMRFSPARVKGRAVKQMVQQPFTFALAPH